MIETFYYSVETKYLEEFTPKLIEFGFMGWDLVYVNANTFLFNKIDAPLQYQIVKVDSYMNDFETSATTLGLSGWIFVDIVNSFAFFKKFAIS